MRRALLGVVIRPLRAQFPCLSQIASRMCLPLFCVCVCGEKLRMPLCGITRLGLLCIVCSGLSLNTSPHSVRGEEVYQEKKKDEDRKEK